MRLFPVRRSALALRAASPAFTARHHHLREQHQSDRFSGQPPPCSPAVCASSLSANNPTQPRCSSESPTNPPPRRYSSQPPPPFLCNEPAGTRIDANRRRPGVPSSSLVNSAENLKISGEPGSSGREDGD
ncbi:polyribonucleotide nucleotidyltransferase [Striga asiatica]|uniref:Polyribonucleotide nucleotidyltransferase n=1 Tax=Striga asiatica TaxID=4170 RepID=A0A5A7NYH6_STRAF|nr:polyribonucleotide nucleotidyltransferase [Striga asiatica]